jgi:hypothetical protein
MRSQTDGSWFTIWKISSEAFLGHCSKEHALQSVRNELNDYMSSAPEGCNHHLSIPIQTENGFAIDLITMADGFRVWFGDLEEDFPDLDEAFIWISLALSDEYQLRTVIVGAKACEWFLEPVEQLSGSQMILARGNSPMFRSFLKESDVRRRNRPKFVKLLTVVPATTADAHFSVEL